MRKTDPLGELDKLLVVIGELSALRLGQQQPHVLELESGRSKNVADRPVHRAGDVGRDLLDVGAVVDPETRRADPQPQQSTPDSTGRALAARACPDVAKPVAACLRDAAAAAPADGTPCLVVAAIFLNALKTGGDVRAPAGIRAERSEE